VRVEAALCKAGAAFGQGHWDNVPPPIHGATLSHRHLFGLGALFFRQILPFGPGEVFELLLAHRLGHLFGSPFEGRLRSFTALHRERGASGHLLFLRFRGHTRISCETRLTVATWRYGSEGAGERKDHLPISLPTRAASFSKCVPGQ
jgi:hypothetical protein